jgi:SET domain-containing protein
VSRATSTRTYVAESAIGGRGVFAVEPIDAGDVVETAPVIVMTAAAVEALEATPLHDHLYEWTDDGDIALAFGHASFYNHAADPTCEYEAHPEVDALVVRARRSIATDEELTIDYTGGGVSPLWFEAQPPPPGAG